MKPKQRAETNLERAQELGARVADHNSNLPLDVSVGEDLEVLWNGYYRVAEPIFSLGTPELARRLDRYFAKAHGLAETVKALECESLELSMTTDEGSRAIFLSDPRQRMPARRAAVVANVVAFANEAPALLAEVRRVCPATR